MIRGGRVCGFSKPWPRKDVFGFSRRRICEIQSHLRQLGYSDEVPDGLFGGKTRRGIGRYQKRERAAANLLPE